MQEFEKVRIELPKMQVWVDDMIKNFDHLTVDGNRPSRIELCKQYEMLKGDTVFRNDTYQVNIDLDSEQNGARCQCNCFNSSRVRIFARMGTIVAVGMTLTGILVMVVLLQLTGQ